MNSLVTHQLFVYVFNLCPKLINSAINNRLTLLTSPLDEIIVADCNQKLVRVLYHAFWEVGDRANRYHHFISRSCTDFK